MQSRVNAIESDSAAPPAPAAFGAFAPGVALARIVRASRSCGPGWAGMRRAFALRKLGQSLAGCGALDVVTYGARMRLTASDNSCEKRLLYTPDYFDPAERRILCERLPAGGSFVDVGANVGGYALFAALAPNRNARVLAIEPQRELCERLAFNARSSGASGLRIIECAVADRDGEAALFIDPRDLARASMRVLGGDGAALERIVPTRTLAAVLESEGFCAPDAMKVDTVGADELALDPYLDAVPRDGWPRLLIVDAVASPAAALAQRLKSRGYAEIARSRANHVFELRKARA